MQQLAVLSPAKINLFLEVLDRRNDGYHNIQTVMQTVNLFDKIDFAVKKDNDITLTTDIPVLPTDETNTIYKTYTLIKKRFNIKSGVDIKLEKHIPIGAGLGGGSSNSASTILAFNTLFKLKLSYKEMLAIAKEIGSDVPFFIKGGLALCTGRGDIVKSIPLRQRLNIVLVCPEKGNSTKLVYKNVKHYLTRNKRNVNLFIKVFERGRVIDMGRAIFNRLEKPAIKINRFSKRIRDVMCKADFLGICLTGSGSAFYGLCNSRKEAMQKAEILEKNRLGRVFVLSSFYPN